MEKTIGNPIVKAKKPVRLPCNHSSAFPPDDPLGLIQQSETDIPDVQIHHLFATLFLQFVQLVGDVLQAFHFALGLQCFNFDGFVGLDNALHSLSIWSLISRRFLRRSLMEIP